MRGGGRGRENEGRGRVREHEGRREGSFEKLANILSVFLLHN